MKFATVLGLSAGVVQAAHMADIDTFCTDAVATCPQAYTDIADCKTKAALFAVGLGPSVGIAYAGAGAAGYINEGTDTFFCRDYHLQAAKVDAATHCTHIGGAGEASPAPCGTDECKKFCTDYTTTCTGTDMKYTDATDCETKCATWLPGKRGYYGAGGNSYGCRRYHLDVAMSSSDLSHCAHAAADGGGVCVNTAVSFCELFGKACKAAEITGLTEYGATCVVDFAALPEGEPGATADNSQECRQYHLDVAFNMGEPEPHCLHASKDGGGVCAEPEPTIPEPGAAVSKSFAGAAAAVTLAVALLV